MAGGQKGASFLGENNVWIAGLSGFAVFCIMSGLGFSACDSDPAPIEQHATDCQQAWSDNEKGKADDEAKALLATDFCDTNNRLAVAEVQTNQQTELMQVQEEQQQELQEAQTP